MKRRELLKFSAGIAAGAALGTAGCAMPGVRQVGDRLVPEDIDAFLGGWDSHLAEIGQSKFVEGFAAGYHGRPLSADQLQDLEPSETLCRRMLHTLVLTQSFRDLSEDSQRHPEVQKRMLDNAQEINDTVFAVSTHLEGMDASQRKAIQEALLRRPDLAMEIAETFDGAAARAGMTGRRRVQLRSMMTQTSFRLSKADPGTVIDECVGKVKRVSEPRRAEMLSSLTAAQAGNEAFFRSGQSDYGTTPTGPTPAAAPDTSADLPLWRRQPGGGAIHSGLYMMGIGAVTFGISALIVKAGTFGLVYGMTAGALLFAIGLITLIVDRKSVV